MMNIMSIITTPKVVLRIMIVVLFLSQIVVPQSIINTLPGYPGELPFKLETGYIEVGETEDVHLFYYFIESERNPRNDPLIIWIPGGPGCTALFDLFYEIGPLCFNYAKSKGDKLTLELNPYSWTKVANIIFLDQPVGTGFSYADSIEDWKTSDTISATQTYNFLKKWLRNHPKFYNNPLYVGGISYAGIVVPAIVQNIYTGNENGNETPLNIKGYMIGNPLTDKFIDFNSRVQFAHRLALLSDELFKSSKENCQGDYIQSNSTNAFCQNDLKAINKCLDRINQWHVLEPTCEKIETPNLKVLKGDGASYEDNPISMETWCRDDTRVFMTMWANDKTVQKALHIREGTIREWMRCNSDFSYEKSTSIYYTFNIRSSVNYHRNFTSKRCRALIFSGDHDMTFSYVGTEKWIRSLNLTVKNNWDPWFVGNQVAGYTSTFTHNDYSLIFATVKGAGHTVPEYKPKECLAMAERWFADYPL